MIRRLSIRNYALIKEIDLDLAAGFNVVTGETGAGKSVMLGALGLLQGGRLSSKSALHPGKPAVVEAIFDMTPAVAAAAEHVLMEASLPSAATSLTLRREISPSGRSKAYVNGSPANLTVLQELSALLVDIHSQQANLRLADPAFQLSTLDIVAGSAGLLDEYRAIYARYRAALKEYSDMRDEIDRTRADADYLRFQFDKLDEADPQPGEIARLEADRSSLAARISSGEQLIKAATALSWDDGSALPSVDIAIDALSALPDDDPARADSLARLEALRIELADIADSIASRASDSRDEPRDLDEIDERLSLLYTLLNRHGVKSDTELAAIRDDLAARLRRLDEAPSLLRDLKAAAVELKRQAIEAADRLSAARTAAAGSLASDIVANAMPLAMPNLACSISVEPGKLNPDGRDTVTWLFAFNKNQPLVPVGQTASGGEVSRIMLVLKCILAGRIGLPTIIFDEVDTGVSGDVAARMGALMARAAGDMQVITITHLPQVAARGDCQFKVFKLDDDTGTVTHIRLLDRAGRRAELAAMLSGDAANEAALAAADSLLQNH